MLKVAQTKEVCISFMLIIYYIFIKIDLLLTSYRMLCVSLSLLIDNHCCSNKFDHKGCIL